MKDDAMDCGTKLLCYCALRHHSGLGVTGQTRKLQTQNAIFIFSSSLISCQLYALHKLEKKQTIITRRTKKERGNYNCRMLLHCPKDRPTTLKSLKQALCGVVHRNPFPSEASDQIQQLSSS